MSLLNIPNDILRNCILPELANDKTSLIKCRFVCRKLRNIIPFLGFTILHIPTAKIAELGHLNILKWIASIIRIDNGVYVYAALGGHLSILKWAKENGQHEFIPLVSSYAASRGHLDVLEWLYQNGTKFNTNVCSSAARNGHLKILKWLRKIDCPWDSETCSYAALGGHLETLKWARQNGCDWNQDTCKYAAYNDHKEVFNWALSSGCPDSHMYAWILANKIMNNQNQNQINPPKNNQNQSSDEDQNSDDEEPIEDLIENPDI